MTGENSTQYEFHEAANLFPMMDANAFAELCSDIYANGLIEPIWLHAGKIIDGRNRFNACQETGTPARFREWDGNGSLVQFVVSLNINRRHLTPSQKAAVAVEMLPMLEAEAKERQKMAGVERAAGERNECGQLVPELGHASDSSRQPTAVRIAATAIGVSHGNISEMKRIARVAPEMAEDVKRGKIKITTAIRDLKSDGRIENKNKEVKQQGLERRDMKKNPFSDARQFTVLAISHLKQIRNDDPQRVTALLEVRNYINQQLGE